MYIQYNFKNQKQIKDDEYELALTQKDSDNNMIIGGETYHIKVYDRQPFVVDTGDNKIIVAGQEITLTANPISLPVTYHWYNKENKLIENGQSVTVSPYQDTKYILEVIDLKTGIKGTDSVNVYVKDGEITNLSPNPASSNINIEYIVNNISNAQIAVVDVNNLNELKRVNLNNNANSYNLNTESLSNGAYTLLLIVNNNIVDDRQFLINN